MGNERNGAPGKLAGQTGTTNTAGGPAARPAGAGTGAANTETGRPAAGPAQETPRQGIPGLALVEVPGTETKKGPGRPPGSGKEKSKAVPNNGPVAADPQLEQTITMVLKTIFDLVAIPGGSVWKLSAPEAQAIAGPSARLAARYGITEAGGKYTDWFMLISTLAIIVAPRMMVTMANRKDGKKNVSSGTVSAGTNPGGAPPVPGGQGVRPPAGHGENNVRQLLPGLA